VTKLYLYLVEKRHVKAEDGRLWENIGNFGKKVPGLGRFKNLLSGSGGEFVCSIKSKFPV